ncbi:MAG: CHAT domain-containing protein [Saprospiraceae bacterium]|nr:CHAT domain-containing protein [Saprospiraceae bacterium]
MMNRISFCINFMFMLGFSTLCDLNAGNDLIVYSSLEWSTHADTLRGQNVFDETLKLETTGQYSKALQLLDSLRTTVGVTLQKEDSLFLAQIYHQKGNCNYRLRNYDWAIRFHDSAKFIRNKIFGYQHSETAGSWYMLGNVYLDLRNFEKARLHYDSALWILKNLPLFDSIKVGSCYFALANVANLLAEPSRARDYFLQSLILLPEYNPKFWNIRQTVLYGYSQYLLEEGELLKATETLNSALSLYYRGKSKSLLTLGQIFNGMALLNQKKGFYDSAMVYANNALSIYSKIYANNKTVLAPFYLNIGNLYKHKRDYKRAKAALFTGIEFCAHPQQTNDKLNLGKIMGSLGSLFSDMEDYHKALEYQKQALNLFLDVPGLDSLIAGSAYMKLGVAYKNVKNYSSAFDSYSKADQYLSNYRKGLNLDNIHNKQNICNLISDQGHYQWALDTLNAYLNEVVEITGGKMHFELGDYYMSLGGLYKKLKRYNEAIIHFKIADTIFKHTTPLRHPLRAHLYASIFETYSLMGAFEEGLPYIESVFEALDVKSIEKVDYFKVSRLHLLIQAFYAKGNFYLYWFIRDKQNQYLEESINAYEAALKAFEFQSRTVHSDYSKFLLADKYFSVFGGLLRALDYLDTEGGKRQALVVAEKGRAQILRDMIQKDEANDNFKIPKILADVEEQLRLASLSIEVGRHELMKSQDKESRLWLDSLDKKYLELNTQRELFYKKIENEYPEYYASKYKTEEIAVDQMQSRMDPDQSILEYFVSDSLIYIFVVNKNSFNMKVIPNNFHLEDQVRDMLEGITIKSMDTTLAAINGGWSKFYSASQMLYKKLVAPVQEFLCNTLVIVPDKALCFIPFEALVVEDDLQGIKLKNPGYWVRTKTIVYSFSAALFYKNNKESHTTTLESNTCLAMAPFAQSGELSNYAMRSEFHKLPYSKRESVEVLSIIGKGNSAMDMNATTDYFINNAINHNIILLSTHGKADRNAGDYSYIAFADRKLYVREIFGLNLKADLVILSACETGMGQWKNGEGLIGMNYAFAFAGAKNICSTLWQVNDKATAELTSHFVDNAFGSNKKSLSLAAALRDAKLKLLNRTATAHPYYWAAMVELGRMD